MKAQKGPVLRDGTTVESLVDLQMREVKLRALSDPEIYEIEQRKVFGKVWLLLGHESEIPNAGDYVQRHMGDDSVIVARDRAGQIHVNLNVCPHRGMKITTHEAGNAQVHTCIYHGWAFTNSGDFLGAPVAEECMHGKMLSKEQLGLQKARVQLYGGLIWATWNIDGPSLEEFLGDTKWYYDMLYTRSNKGLEVAGPPQRFIVRGNWKTAGEQSAADGYHTLTLHRWLGEGAGAYQSEEAKKAGEELAKEMLGAEVSSPHGHALRCIDLARKIKKLTGKDPAELTVEEKLLALPPPGMTADMVSQLKENLTAEQIQVMSWMPPQVGGMFPNIIFEFLYIPQPDGGVVGSLALHTYVPKGPDKLEFTNWIFVERDTPPELKKQMIEQSVRLLGTSGMVEADDSDTWPHMTLSAKGAQGRNSTMKYQAVYETGAPKGWPGPGIVNEGFTKDDTQWHWWKYWHELMMAEE